jgi:hypothetical protein
MSTWNAPTILLLMQVYLVSGREAYEEDADHVEKWNCSFNQIEKKLRYCGSVQQLG